MAAFVLNGTRFIYEEGKKNISLEVTNNAKDTYGGQIWIDNISQNKSDVFMVPSPPVFKVDAGKKQIIRLMNVNPALPADRESMFRINAQELPPKPAQTEGSVLAIAMNTQVKLIYRPKALNEGRKDAEKKLTTLNKGTTWLKNPTPYYFAVTGLKVNGKTVTIPKEKQAGLAMLAPFSEADTGLNASGKLTVQAINDWGGVQDYAIE
ncbi:fimbrial chaperone [Citrobacter braakii]|uniref:fimbrial chaperone n=3 Tax=Citrobacter braakii TaxID=57706 RepID=UPI003975ECCE